MKILVICLLVSTLSLTFAVPSFNFDYLNKYLPSLPKEDNKDEASALLQALVSTEDDQDADNDEDDGTVADLQGVFNVLAQVETEKARVQDGKSTATDQFWGGLGRLAWGYAKNRLKKKYCTEEEEVKAIVQELIGEQALQQDGDAGDSDDKARAELQTLFDALKKVEAKAMQDDSSDDNVDAQGWFKRLRRKIRRGAKKLASGFTRRYLC